MSFGRRFLRYPDLFPARRSGEVWGDREIVIELPGGPYLFRGLSEAQYLAMQERYGDFLAETGGPCIETTVFASEDADFLEIDTRGWEYTIDFDHTPTSACFAGVTLMARLDCAPAQAGAVWTSESRRDHFIGVIENFFRPLVAYQLVSRGGLLLHSSGVIVGGEGVLFVGHSGAGKSTVAGFALERGLEILSDDLNVVLPSGDGWEVARMPFAGEHPHSGSPATVRLGSIYELVKGVAHTASELSPASGYALLLSCSPYVNANPYRAGELDATITRIVESTPVRRLNFSRDPGFWPIIEAK